MKYYSHNSSPAQAGTIITAYPNIIISLVNSSIVETSNDIRIHEDIDNVGEVSLVLSTEAVFSTDIDDEIPSALLMNTAIRATLRYSLWIASLYEICHSDVNTIKDLRKNDEMGFVSYSQNQECGQSESLSVEAKSEYFSLLGSVSSRLQCTNSMHELEWNKICEIHYQNIMGDNQSSLNTSFDRNRCVLCAISSSEYEKGGIFGSNFLVTPPDPSDPVVAFLGTGCATPSKHRSNSGILIKATEKLSRGDLCPWNILLDAGESVSCQLFNSCGCDTKRYADTLVNIRIIWISHHHADHHAGLSKLLEDIHLYHRERAGTEEYMQQWSKVPASTKQRVVVIAPISVLEYTEYLCCVAGIDDIVQFVDITRTTMHCTPSRRPAKNSDDDWYWAAGPLLSKHVSYLPVLSVPVEHCRNSFGVVLSINRFNIHESTSRIPRDPVTIVFSGDCRPSASLVHAGQMCTLLIHEASFDDNMHADAIQKRHCTTGEALQVGREMNAKNIVLTHFSQRYPKAIETRVREIPSNGTEEIQPSISYNELSEVETISRQNESYINAVDFLHFAVPSQLSSASLAMNILGRIVHTCDEEHNRNTSLKDRLG